MLSLIEIPCIVSLKLNQGSIQPGFSGGEFVFKFQPINTMAAILAVCL